MHGYRREQLVRYGADELLGRLLGRSVRRRCGCSGSQRSERVAASKCRDADEQSGSLQ